MTCDSRASTITFLVRSMSLSKNLQLTAYHEAGHAVLATALIDSPQLVSIKRTGRRLGHIQYCNIVVSWAYVQVLLAGNAASHMFANRAPADFEWAANICSEPQHNDVFLKRMRRDDIWLATQATRQLTGASSKQDVLGQLMHYYAVTRDCLREVWSAVQALAETLIKVREVEDARSCMGPLSDNLFHLVRAVQLRWEVDESAFAIFDPNQ